MLTSLSDPYPSSSTSFGFHQQPQFPNIKQNATAVEGARLPSRLVKKPIRAVPRTTPYPINSQFPLPILPVVAAKSSTIDIFEQNLQILCGPGPSITILLPSNLMSSSSYLLLLENRSGGHPISF